MYFLNLIKIKLIKQVNEIKAGLEADKVNTDEKKECASKPPQGVSPVITYQEILAKAKEYKSLTAKKQSIRKRGFHRAVKRGEQWALLESFYKQTMNSIYEQMFGLKK